MRRRFFLALATITSFRSLVAEASDARTQSKGGKSVGLGYDLKLDEESAVKIAEVIFVKVYGERALKERPWKVRLEADDSVFHIEGTFDTSKGAFGGVGEIKIRRSNAEVVSIMHGK